MNKEQISLLPKVFLELRRRCLDRVKKADLDREKEFNVRQLYGFDTNHSSFDFNSPSLKSMIEEDPRVKGEFQGRGIVNQLNINGKYLYDKYRGKQKASDKVVLEGFYTWVYFVFLGYESAEAFIDTLLTEATLSAREHQLQMRMLRELLVYGKETFGCYHFSELWKGIFCIEIEIDFDNKDFKDRFARYSLTALSAMSDKEQEPVQYRGTATHEGSNLHIKLLSTNLAGGMKSLIFSMERHPKDIGEDTVFLGTYQGISRNSDIITGPACFIKKSPDKDISEVPMPIKRFLYLDKQQFRTPLEPLGYDIDSLPHRRDEEDLLPGFVGTYKFCWLASKARLIISELVIEKSYDFNIKTFLSKNGSYSGFLEVRRGVLCLDSIRLERKKKGRQLAASIYLNISNSTTIDGFESKVIQGVYILGEATARPKYGTCLALVMEEKDLPVKPVILERSKLVEEKDQLTLNIYDKIIALEKEYFGKIENATKR